MALYPQIGRNTDMPWREWFQFKVATLGFTNAATLAWANAVDKLTDDHWSYGLAGQAQSGGILGGWATILKGNDPDFELASGMDELLSIGIYYQLALQVNTCVGETHVNFGTGELNDPQGGLEVDWNAVTGKKYDGVNNWPAFPIRFGDATSLADQKESDGATCIPVFGSDGGCPAFGDFPESRMNWFASWDTWGGVAANAYQSRFFDYGIVLEMLQVYSPPNWGNVNNGETLLFSLTPQKIKAYFFNPVVNSIAPGRMKTIGDFTIDGLGFDIPETSFDIYDWNNTETWDDRVYQIDFIGMSGEGTFSVNEAQFASRTNTQIVIAAGNMPALPDGSYEILLHKKNNNTPAQMDEPEAYAGDWRSDDDGRVHEGTRMILLIGGASEYIAPLILTNWRFKNPAGASVLRSWAPIDVSAPKTFYDGRIVNVSGLKRALDGKTGLYSISDMTVTVSNTDQEITDLLASYMARNQLVEIFHTWQDIPEAWKYQVFRGIVDNVREKQPNYEFVIKDVLQKYFNKKVPVYILTEAEYPNIKDSSINKCIPERIGLHYLSTADTKGACLAFCVDTSDNEYIAARGSLHSITEVYADNVLVNPANYAVLYKDGGRTYINFTVDMGNAKITFNCTGYMFGSWNSANGYVQNPAYVIAFLFALLAEIPIAFLNLAKIDEVATILDDQGYGESGRLDLATQREFDAVLAELLFTCGAKGFNGRDGRFEIEIKDISSFTTSKMLWSQLDVTDRITRDLYKGLVNRIRFRGDSYPGQSFFRYADIMTHAKSITDFEAEIESRSQFDFPWTDAEDLILSRVSEELLKRAYGDKRINFSLPIRFIEELDLHSNITFQDLIRNESGRYFYIESIDYNFATQAMKMIAIDLQYLIETYFILGDEDVLPSDWINTLPDQRIYGYMCDEITGLLPDGTPGKAMIDENLVGV
jgi:hypothetical protein